MPRRAPVNANAGPSDAGWSDSLPRPEAFQIEPRHFTLKSQTELDFSGVRAAIAHRSPLAQPALTQARNNDGPRIASTCIEGAAGIMSTKTRTTKERRRHKLKRMLEDRSRELVHEVQGKIRHARNGNAKECDVLDEGESCEIDFQAEIGFALLQIKVETLNAIDAAVRRLEEGTYGDCVECGDDIHEARLQALPFAVRCRECEEAREMSTDRGRGLASRHGSSPFVELSN